MLLILILLSFATIEIELIVSAFRALRSTSIAKFKVCSKMTLRKDVLEVALFWVLKCPPDAVKELIVLNVPLLRVKVPEDNITLLLEMVASAITSP